MNETLCWHCNLSPRTIYQILCEACLESAREEMQNSGALEAAMKEQQLAKELAYGNFGDEQWKDGPDGIYRDNDPYTERPTALYLNTLEAEVERLKGEVAHHAREQSQHEEMLSWIMGLTGAQTNHLRERLEQLLEAEREVEGYRELKKKYDSFMEWLTDQQINHWTLTKENADDPIAGVKAIIQEILTESYDPRVSAIAAKAAMADELLKGDHLVSTSPEDGLFQRCKWCGWSGSEPHPNSVAAMKKLDGYGHAPKCIKVRYDSIGD